MKSKLVGLTVALCVIGMAEVYGSGGSEEGLESPVVERTVPPRVSTLFGGMKVLQARVEGVDSALTDPDTGLSKRVDDMRLAIDGNGNQQLVSLMKRVADLETAIHTTIPISPVGNTGLNTLRCTATRRQSISRYTNPNLMARYNDTPHAQGCSGALHSDGPATDRSMLVKS
ncbi:MAG: hypothetical protein LBJ69_03150 [Holosporales bacterium]|jgi:hypothetical protein|nr:hypothetical protein [Holosporales bacterium]